MRLMGLDVGDRRIGAAVSDEMGLTAQGTGVFQVDPKGEKVVSEIIEEARRTGVDGFVVGVPRNMDGSYGPRAEKTLEFAARLGQETGLPVYRWDERLTTVEAERVLVSADMSRQKRKKVIDKMAAVLILQGYLDANPR